MSLYSRETEPQIWVNSLNSEISPKIIQFFSLLHSPRLPRLQKEVLVVDIRCISADRVFVTGMSDTKQPLWWPPILTKIEKRSFRSSPKNQRFADYSMYSTFLTASPGSVLFNRSNLLKRKDLCFSCLRLGLITHRRSLRSSHLISSGLTRFCRVTTREADILVNISIGIQIVLSPRTVFYDWLNE